MPLNLCCFYVKLNEVRDFGLELFLFDIIKATH